MTQSDFKNQVDNLMGILFGAGVASHATIIEQINYLVFLRSLSRKDDNAMILDSSAEKIFSGELRKYHWDNLLILNADELFTSLEEVFRKLPEVSNDPTIKLLFRDAHVKVFDKPTLRRLVHEIEKMFSDLEKQSTSGHTDIFGDMYEYLLSKLSQAGTLGSFRTPRHIIKFIVDVIDPKKGETILDPACGTAGFLVAALKHLEEKYTSEEYKKLDKYPMDSLTPQERDFVYKYTFTGFDSDFDMFKFGLMNLYLHKLEHPNIKRQNTLVDTAGDRTKWDVILANPPFAGALDIDSVSEDLRMGTRSTELLFLRYMMDHLSSSGRAGVIVPEGVVFNSTNAHKKIRQMLVEDAGLWCVVSLPGGIFNPYAGVKTSILFFDKSLKNKVKDILFVKVENDGFDLGATKRPIDKNDLPTALMAINIYKKAIEKGKMADFDLLLDSNAVATSIGNIKELGYDLTADDQVTLVKAINKVLQSEIKNHSYNLNGDQYGNEIIKENTKWPIVKLGEVTKLMTGGTPKTSNKEYYGGNIKWLVSGDIHKEEIYDCEGRITELALKESNARLLPINSVLIALNGQGKTRGTVALLKTEAACNQSLVSIDPDLSKLTPEFLFYILKNQYQKIREINGDKQRGGLNMPLIRSIQIPLPPLEIQKQIVEELDGYQKIIDGAKQIIENWKPTFKIDPTWKIVNLSEISEYFIGLTYSPKDVTEDGIIVLRSSNIQNNELDFSDIVRVSKQIKEKIFVKDGDILMCSRNGSKRLVGKTALIKDLKEKMTFGTFMTVIRGDYNDYLSYFFITDYFRNQLNSETSSINQITKYMLDKIKVPFPSEEERKKMVCQIENERSIVDPLKKLIKLYQEKINKKIEEVWGE